MAEDFAGWKVEISQDGMKAVLHMEPPSERNPYTVDETISYIKSQGVVNGISFSTVEEAVEMRRYYKDIPVAEGRVPRDGVNGYYDFFFDTGTIKKPTIRSDGSVDYSSMTVIHSVRTGDKLAVYHPAVAGEHGYDVRGRELRCKPGKELPTLKGSGFELCFDGVTYVASQEGRVDYRDYKLTVTDLYELRGDLDLVTGRIDFLGDVVVKGNVRSGTTIRASKSITVEGSVEAATLISEGDIVLKKGMQGGQRSKIMCGGDLFANFIEFTDVDVKGNIEANIAMNCRMHCGKTIKIAGKRGTIVGGSTYAVNSINTTNLGNIAETKTIAGVGITDDLDKRNHLLRTKAEISKSRIEKAKKDLATTLDARIALDSQEVRIAKANQLRRHIKRDERLLEHINEELGKIEEMMNLGQQARIDVTGKVYPGSVIRIAEKEMPVKQEMNHVEFYCQNSQSDIETRAL